MTRLLPPSFNRRLVLGVMGISVLMFGTPWELTGVFGIDAIAAAQVIKDNSAITVPAEPPVKPEVVLSAEHQKLCRVGVGDTMPELAITNTKGQKQTLAELLGKKLTVVLFWNANHRYALAEFEHLQREVMQPFVDSGVVVVAIHVGPPPENYAALIEKQGKGIICLIDADQTAFKQIASSKLPRTYLLDRSGKILWFDIEYSRTTRYDLKNAVRYYLAPPPKAK